MEVGVFLLLFSCITQISALEITYNTKFGDKISLVDVNDNRDYYIINMHEEIEPPYLFGTFEDASGSEPRIAFITPNQNANSSFRLDVSESLESPGTFEMIVTNRQDYESSYFEDIEKSYVFTISTTNSGSAFVDIKLININDNEPLVVVNNSTCLIEENDDTISSCSYTIKDDDGYMTKTKWSLGDDNDKVFQFDYEPISNDDVKEITLYLEPVKPLDYETIPLYIMQLTVTDTPIKEGDEALIGTGNIVVSVTDLPDTDPVWVQIFASEQFPELVHQEFQVTARDGDIGVNDPITYRLDNNWPQYISINPDTGLITVEPIDRDTDGEIIYTFTVIACEVSTEDACVQQLITFLVEDLNNKFPVITVDSTVTTIRENSFGNLEFIISANDMDMGENAMYEITLDSVDGQHSAFTVAPGAGYQKSDINIYILDRALLDYDRNDIWREFTLQLITRDVTEPRNLYSVDLTIILENVNDEVPQFVYGDEDDESAYIAYVLETAPIDDIVKEISATDADIGDSVRYEILGTYINGILTIDSETGVISTAINGAFDYETQEEVVLQVQVTDIFEDEYNTTLNTAVTSLTINVIDVNDETPRISVASNQIRIPENQEHDTIILNAQENYLVASDDDQTAFLEFEIDWNNSYATKTGQLLSDEAFAEYHNCINLKWEDTDTATGRGKSITAELRINDVVSGDTPDFEVFDILYIHLTAIDKNQEENDNTVSVIVPIYIDDVDDVAPVFTESTISSYKSVNEEVEIDTTIAIIIATDVDSDRIYYTLTPTGDTPTGLVDINEVGELYVSGRIDADEPKLYNLTYTVTASDRQRPTDEDITIFVNDVNDNEPIWTVPSGTAVFNVMEKSIDGTHVTDLVAIDKDRDDTNNVVNYLYSSSTDSQLRNFFNIQDGAFIVSTMDGNYILDRDNQVPAITNSIRITAYDGSTSDSRSSEVSFTIILTDINDQVPVIDILEFSASEEMKEGETIGTILATDADQAGTNNSKIDFEIMSVFADDSSKDPPVNMFVLSECDNVAGTCILKTGIDLQTYYGTYSIVVNAYDLGEPPQSGLYTITVTIEMYNFLPPSFIIPKETTLYLREQQTLNRQLLDYNSNPIEDFAATDRQGEKYDLIFSVEDSDVFKLAPMGSSTSQLQLKEEPTEKEYTITISVTAEFGIPQQTTPLELNIIFLDLTEEPTFNPTTQTITLVENTTGQLEEFVKANYSNIPAGFEDLYTVYYRIVDADRSPFSIKNNEENFISLDEYLDRETEPTHQVEIQAYRYSNNGASLYLTVELLDINDNPPNFDQSTYYEKILTTTSIGTTILTVHATDADDGNTLTYYIDEFNVIPNSLNSKEPFLIEDSSTGIITSNVEIPSTGDGYFLFTIRVNDGEWNNSATVHIYMVSDAHRVEFVFTNDITTVNNARREIQLILQSHFGYNVIIEQIIRSTDDDGNAMDGITIVQVYFVNSDENEAVIKGTIEEAANVVDNFVTLFNRFGEHNLVLARSLDNAEQTDNTEQILKAWLIGISIVLGTLCVLLLVIFIVKTRSLTQRLNKLSVIQYGSQDSGLNRKVAPTTNKHAIEGSNPAYNEEKVRSPENDDAMSVGSGDSDLVGVENNPEFDYNYEVDKKNPEASRDIP